MPVPRLTPCPTCGQQVATTAPSCPKCGMPDPGCAEREVDEEVERLSAPEPVRVGRTRAHAGAQSSRFDLMEWFRGQSRMLQVLLALGFMFSLCVLPSMCSDTSEPAAVAESDRPVAVRPKAETLPARVDSAFGSLERLDTTSLRGDKIGIAVVVGMLKSYAGLALEAEAANHPKADDLKARVVAAQRREFPRLRDALGPALRADFWKENMEVRTSGAGYRTIRFTGAAFASNANIGTFHSDVLETLQLLRFRTAEYEWYRDASDMQFYTMENVPADGDLVP